MDSNGEIHTFEGDDLKNMSTHFGMLGFVTEMTLNYSPILNDGTQMPSDECATYFGYLNPVTKKQVAYMPQTGDCPDFQNDVSTRL